MLTPAELQAISERAEKATAGPWISEEEKYIGVGPHEVSLMFQVVKVEKENMIRLPATIRVKKDLDFIAHSRQDIPSLLSHIQEQDQYGRECQRVIDELVKQKLELEAKLSTPDIGEQTMDISRVNQMSTKGWFKNRDKLKVTFTPTQQAGFPKS